MRRTLQYLRAALELLAQLLLHLREVAQRVARLFAVHLLRRILQLLHLRHQLRRHRLPKQRLRLTELTCERRVQGSGGLELLLELLRRLSKLLHTIGHRSLLLRETPRLFCGLEVHGTLLLATRIGCILRTTCPRLCARRLIRPLRERLLLLCGGQRLFDSGLAECTRGGALLLAGSSTQNDLATHTTLRPRRRVHGFGAHRHRVARREVQRVDIHARTASPTRANAAPERLHDGRGIAHTGAHDAERYRRHTVIVGHQYGELHRIARHEQGVSGGLGDDDMRRGVCDHNDV